MRSDGKRLLTASADDISGRSIMSKVFRVLVDIFIAVCLIAVAALLVPPLIGVKTEVAAPAMDRNLTEGTVTYGVRRPAATLSKGDEIVFSDEEIPSLYLYTVISVDADNSVLTVLDPATSQELDLEVGKNITKKVLVLPYLGYILLALRSPNGLAMLISAAAFLVALFLIALLWDKKSSAAKAEVARKSEGDEEYFAALARSVEQPGKLDEIYRSPAAPETPQNAAAGMSAATQNLYTETSAVDGRTKEIDVNGTLAGLGVGAAAGAAAAAGADEILEVDTNPDFPAIDESAAVQKSQPVIRPETVKVKEKAVGKDNGGKAVLAGIGVGAAAAAAVNAAQNAKDDDWEDIQEKPEPDRYTTDNIIAAFSNVPDDKSAASLDIAENEIPDVSNALVAALETTQVSRPERTYQTAAFKPVPEPVEEELDEVELAIPVKTANEILDEAYAKGYDPQVITDDVTGVKLVDFSDCF